MKASTYFVLAGALCMSHVHADPRPEPGIHAGDPAPRVPAGGSGSYSVTGDDFHLASTTAPYHTDGLGHLYCESGASIRIASAAVHIPAGRRLAYLDLWGRDDSPSDIVSATLYATCHASDAPGDALNTTLATVTSEGHSGLFFEDSTVPTHYANPEQCAYSINLQLGLSGACEGDALLVSKVRVVWY